MKKIWLFFFLTFCILHAKNYTKHFQAKAVMHQLIKEKYFTRSQLQQLFSNVKLQKSALNAFVPRHKQYIQKETRSVAEIQKAKEISKKYGSWGRYSRYILSQRRVTKGVEYIKKYQNTFEAVEERYGVPKEYIAAIIGIESAFGKNVGKYPVFDTLVTLAFEKNRRNRFFKKELIAFLKLSKTQKFNPKNVRGSYAGAIGLVQFMPSNYIPYGVDFNQDGRISLQNPQDAIASVANYFKKHGWRTGEPIATKVKYQGTRFNKYKTGYRYEYNRSALKGIEPYAPWEYEGKVRLIKLDKKHYDELWYGTKNFYVITRYNHSAYYAMAVHQLAQKIKKRLNK